MPANTYTISVGIPAIIADAISTLYSLTLVIYMSLYGLNHGISAPFIGALWAEIYGVESLGTVKALLHAGGVFASALSPLIFGYLIDIGFGISIIVIISILIIIVSTLLPIYNKLP